MATSGYSEDLQPQQANAVTIATAAATPPSATKTAHFLSEIPPAPGSIVSASQSAAPSKTVPANPNPNPKAVVLTSPTPHYVTPDIQHSAAQKSNGQSSSPQYIIVTVTGERLADDWHTHIAHTYKYSTQLLTLLVEASYDWQSVQATLCKFVLILWATAWMLFGDGLWQSDAQCLKVVSKDKTLSNHFTNYLSFINKTSFQLHLILVFRCRVHTSFFSLYL